jgi:dTDP-4-amino-4,6-dideoxygalactose transaminase
VTEQLQVLDSQARREREIAEQLSKQLEEHSKAQASLEDVQGQTAQIFRILSERDGEDRMDEVKSAQIESKAKYGSQKGQFHDYY